MIVGVDEVGRGPWAGPLVMAAVGLSGEIEGLTDSKKLSKKRREALNQHILEHAAAIGIGWVFAAELDELGMSAALRECCKRAIKDIAVPFHEVIIDGTVNFLSGTPLEAHTSVMKKADLLVPSVSAASIVAKVARDSYMADLDTQYEGYDFAAHAGYGTAKHRAAIERYGVTPEHRLSFAPLQQYRMADTLQSTRVDASASTTTRQIGDASEAAAARELEQRGHQIVAMNWKTKACEIDIVSTLGETLYFTEVKHRRSADTGDGLAAITPKKLRQMRYAAAMYVHFTKSYRYDLRLLAVATTGDPPEVTSVESVI